MFSVYPESRTSSHNVVVLSDNDGTVEVTEADGKQSVKIKDGGGQEIFSGALNNDADRGAVPEKYRAKVKDAEDRIKANMAGATKKPQKKLQLRTQPQNQVAPPLPLPPAKPGASI